MVKKIVCYLVSLFFVISLSGLGFAQAESLYKDVPVNSPYADAIAELSQKGIFQGCNGEFFPNKNITNGQACLILCRLYYPQTVNNVDAARSLLTSRGITSITGAANNFAAKDNILSALLQLRNYEVVYDSTAFVTEVSAVLNYASEYETEALAMNLESVADITNQTKMTRGEYAAAIEKVLNTESPFLNCPETLTRISVEYRGISKKICGNTANAMKYLPQKLVDGFNADGGKLVLCDTQFANVSLAAMGTYGHGSGNPVITITAKDGVMFARDDKKVKSSNSLLHEFGHYLDDLEDGYFTDGNENIQRSFSIQKERDNMVYLTDRQYCLTNIMEYFADVFEIYCVEPQVLKTMCPNAYQAVEERLANYQ